MSRSVLVVFLLIFTACAQAQSSLSGCGYANIVFGNGVGNTRKEANATRKELKNRFKQWISSRPALGIDPKYLDFSYVAYNPSDGVTADLLEAGRQEGFDWTSAWGVILLLQQASAPGLAKELQIVTDALATPPQATEDAIADHASKYASFLNEGRKVVIVAHSQGNYFANAAVDRLSDYGLSADDKKAVAIVPVASPDSRIARSVVPHLRIGDGLPGGIAEDAVIFAASIKRELKGLEASLPANTEDPYGNAWLNVYRTVPDGWRHSFLDAYLYPGSQAEQRVFEWIALSLRRTANPRCFQIMLM